MSEQLSKRSVAWHGWHLMPGMRILGVGLVVYIDGDGDAKVFGDDMRWHDEQPSALPDLDNSGTQGCVLTIIADNNARKSMADALADVRHAMGRGLSFPEALVFVLESCP